MSPDHSVEFNFEIPSDYRKNFVLILGASSHKISVNGNKMNLYVTGNPSTNDTSKILDWMQESVEMVRQEFGH